MPGGRTHFTVGKISGIIVPALLVLNTETRMAGSNAELSG